MQKNIAFIHYVANYTDGVSLEMNKWRRVLEEMGYHTRYIAGKFDHDPDIVIEEMYHHRSDARLLNRNTFEALSDYPDETVYRSELYRLADAIEQRLRAVLDSEHIDLLIPQNVFSVAMNPAVAIALTRVMCDYNLPILAHHHDFYFERPKGFALTNAAAVELSEKHLPPRHPRARHVVINSLAQRELFERKGIQATVVPNVFDFDAPNWQMDDYNRDLRARIGLRPNDILVLQATRIVPRKGIELAVDFVHALNHPQRRKRLRERGLYNGRSFTSDSRIVLVLAGYSRDDITGRYKTLLTHKAQQLNVEVVFIEEIVNSSRQMHNGEKIYSLWDTYTAADFITYPSLWEGWGNQLLEALHARVPLMLFEYPVYRADIKSKGLRVVSLGDQISGHDEAGLVTIRPEVIEKAADQAVELLTDARLRRETVAHNFQVARKHYSLIALHRYLEQLLRSFDNGNQYLLKNLG